jgi:hypothetical protein
MPTETEAATPLTTFGVVDREESRLYFVASRFLLPAALVLLTVSADVPR